jgi:hypothetical protein
VIPNWSINSFVVLHVMLQRFLGIAGLSQRADERQVQRFHIRIDFHRSLAYIDNYIVPVLFLQLFDSLQAEIYVF